MDPKIDFIGIGVGKSGTTTISRLLEAHPEICFSIPKELNHFNKSNSRRRLLKTDNPDYLGNNYSQHFVHWKEGQIRGEFSPSYFIDEAAPKAMHDAYPEAKLIVCLRQPVERAYSSYKMVKNYFKSEERSFEEAIKSDFEYVEKGLYYKHINRYLEYFDRSQIHVVLFEDIVSKPRETIKKLYQWLGVDDTFIPEKIGLKANKAKRSRFKAMTAFEITMVKFITKHGGAKIILWLKKIRLHKIVHFLFTKPYKAETIPAEDANWLMHHFEEDVKALETFLQRDLSHWLKRY